MFTRGFCRMVLSFLTHMARMLQNMSAVLASSIILEELLAQSSLCRLVVMVCHGGNRAICMGSNASGKGSSS